MFRTAVLRGVKAGLVAGLAFGLFVALIGNPLVGAVESGEHAADGAASGDGGHDHAHADGGHDQGSEGGSAVSGLVTDAVGVASGVLWGLLLGLLFGVAAFLLGPAIPGEGAVSHYLLAAAGFVTVSGAPWLLFPPRAPGVEAAAGVDARLALYAGMMAAGAVACALAAVTYRRTAERSPVAGAAAALAPFAGLVALALVLPGSTANLASGGPLDAAVRGVVIVGQIGLWAALATAYARFEARSADEAGTSLDDLDDDLRAHGM